jgi:hypothetical protein
VQIDRAGRAGVTSALLDPFWDTGQAGALETHQALTDAYDQNGDPSSWGAYADRLATNLALYLGVEANATLRIPNQDCGGRAPTENTMDETYSLVIQGQAAGVENGIRLDGDGAPNATTFPFLGTPN